MCDLSPCELIQKINLRSVTASAVLLFFFLVHVAPIYENFVFPVRLRIGE